MGQSRARISQYLIMPHYQRQGHGLELLRIFYRQARAVANLKDITVEDASIDFQIIRHIVDIEDCNKAGLLNLPLTSELEAKVEQQLKLYQPQIRRVFECWRLAHSQEDEQGFRLACKSRLYKMNRELFEGIKDETRRKDMLAEFYEEQVDEYKSALRKLNLPIPTWAAGMTLRPVSQRMGLI